MNRKAVIITGISGDIGFELAKFFDNKGFFIIGTYCNNYEKAQQLSKELNNEHELIQCDLSDFNNADVFFSKILNLNVSIELLINNVGTSVVSLLQDIKKEEWNHLWNTNVTSTVAMCKSIIPLYLKQGYGKIINISSVWGEHGASCEVAYSATKGAINSFTKALAKELALSNIQVNAVSPGIINTQMNGHLSSEELNSIAEEIPTGRIGEVGDVAKTVYSVYQSSSYMTGQIITVDGGWTI